MSFNSKLYGINIPELLILDEMISDSEFNLLDSLRFVILVNTIMCKFEFWPSSKTNFGFYF